MRIWCLFFLFLHLHIFIPVLCNRKRGLGNVRVLYSFKHIYMIYSIFFYIFTAKIEKRSMYSCILHLNWKIHFLSRNIFSSPLSTYIKCTNMFVFLPHSCMLYVVCKAISLWHILNRLYAFRIYRKLPGSSVRLVYSVCRTSFPTTTRRVCVRNVKLIIVILLLYYM